MLSSIFDAFVKESPISIMMRGLMESVFRPQRLEEIFESHSKLQYTRKLLFSSLVDLLSLGVCGIHPSVNAASKAKAAELTVTRGALYQKLNGIETEVSAALLRETATELGQLIEQMGGQMPILSNGILCRKIPSIYLIRDVMQKLSAHSPILGCHVEIFSLIIVMPQVFDVRMRSKSYLLMFRIK